MSATKAQAADVNFNKMYQTFSDKVYKIAFKITRDAYLAEDIVQETFTKAYQKIHSLLELEKMGAWLSTIASHTAIDMIRKEEKSSAIPVENVVYTQDRLTSEQNNVEYLVEQRWVTGEIHQELERMSPVLQTVFFLKYIHGLKEEEIANLFHLPRGTVKSRLYRARKHLKLELHRKHMHRG